MLLFCGNSHLHFGVFVLLKRGGGVFIREALKKVTWTGRGAMLGFGCRSVYIRARHVHFVVYYLSWGMRVVVCEIVAYTVWIEAGEESKNSQYHCS